MLAAIRRDAAVFGGEEMAALTGVGSAGLTLESEEFI